MAKLTKVTAENHGDEQSNSQLRGRARHFCVLCAKRWSQRAPVAAARRAPGYICGEIRNAMEGMGPTGRAAARKLDPGHVCLWSGQMKNVGDLCFPQLPSLGLEQGARCSGRESSRWHYAWAVRVLKLSTRSEIPLSLWDAELRKSVANKLCRAVLSKALSSSFIPDFWCDFMQNCCHFSCIIIILLFSLLLFCNSHSVGTDISL